MKNVLIPVLGLIAVLLISFGIFFLCQRSNNYTVSVSVIVDGKTYTSSEVQKLSCHRAWGWAKSLDMSRCNVLGEAVAVPVADRGYLFVLLDGWDLDPSSGKRFNIQSGTYTYSLFAATGNKPFENHRPYPAHWRVDTYNMPVMARFEDLNDPLSVTQVEPNELEKSFGQGAVLASLEVSRTYDDVTTNNIPRLLPWVLASHGYIKGGGRIDPNDFPTTISAASFYLGGKK